MCAGARLKPTANAVFASALESRKPGILAYEAMRYDAIGKDAPAIARSGRLAPEGKG